MSELQFKDSADYALYKTEHRMKELNGIFKEGDNTLFNFCSEDFKEGAKWRINSAWHSNTEIPNRNLDMYYCGESCMIQDNDGKLNFGIVYYGYGYNGKMFYTVTCLDKTYTMDEIKRWAYIKDLIPMED